MGQKVHPIGFRVGITKRHQSQWFARFTKYSYTQSLLEDRLLRHTIMNFAKESLIKTTANKKDISSKEKSMNPIVTHIKIERGLIPYEINIQIHSENCEKLKLSLNNLKFNKELLCKLQKTRRFLMTASENQQNHSNPLNQAPTYLNTLTDKILVNTQKELTEFSPISSTKEITNSDFFFEQKKQLLKKKLTKKTISSFDLSAKLISPNEKKTKLFFFTFLHPNRNLNKAKNWKKRKRPVFFNLLAEKKQLIKRLEKRQEIRFRSKRLMLKGIFFQKKGEILNNASSVFFSKKEIKKGAKSIKSVGSLAAGNKSGSYFLKAKVLEGQSLNSPSSNLKSNIKLRIKKKFISIFLNKINKRFLKTLKQEISDWNKSLKEHRQEQLKEYGTLRFAPIGYNQKWSLKRLNLLKNKSLLKMLKLIKFIEQHSLTKLESLRRTFIAYGAISKTEILNYYQIINFLKHLKAMFFKLKKEQQTGLIFGSFLFDPKKIASGYPNQTIFDGLNKNSDFRAKKKINNLNSSNLYISSSANYTSRPNGGNLAGKGNLGGINSGAIDLTNECRKLRLIEYLQDMVQNYRTKNLFYFLSTIAEARKNLKKIKEFTKLHSKFLFGFSADQLINKADTQSVGLNSTNNKFQKNSVFLNQIKNTIQLISKADKLSEKKSNPSIKETYLEQLEQQRLMHQQLVQLKPKISIKFYAVNPQKAEIKAVNIAHSIIDALEKRKAFRKAIKDAKEKLMQNVNVKGVKIQVAGRLNGAEIARTEWVRSGRVPLQTLRANLDYSYKTAQTIYGIIGVKVWIFKGYTKLI